jgi:hypothetical protein
MTEPKTSEYEQVGLHTVGPHLIVAVANIIAALCIGACSTQLTLERHITPTRRRWSRKRRSGRSESMRKRSGQPHESVGQAIDAGCGVTP